MNSIIISYKESSEERRNNLKCVLNYLSVLLNNNTELIIVEQDTQSKINWLEEIKNNKFITHIFVKNDSVFNKGWGYNIGAKESKGDFLIFHDSDMFLKIKQYTISLNLLNNCDIVDPYKTVYYLNKNNTKKFTEKYKLNIDDENSFDHTVTSGVISGGIFMIKKSVYLDIKGFDESCFGWGYEDDIFDTKIKKLNLSIKYINDTSIHIFHDADQKNDYYSYKQLNKDIFNEYLNMSEIEIKNKIRSTMFFGEKDKNINNKEELIHKELTKSLLEDILKNINDSFIDDVIKESFEKYHDIFLDVFSEKIKEEFNRTITKTNKIKLVNKIKKK